MKRFILLFLLITIPFYSFGQLSKPAKQKSKWHIRISPHFWFINLKGEIIRPPFNPIPVNPIEPEPKRDFFDCVSFRSGLRIKEFYKICLYG